MEDVVFETRGDILKAIFDSLSEAVSEAVFVFDKSMMTVRAVDPANVMMVGVDAIFAKYHNEKDEEVAVGIDVARIKDYLKVLKKKREVDVIVDLDKNVIKLGDRTVEYTIKLIDADAIRKPPKEPNLNFTVSAGFYTDRFIEAVKMMEKIGDNVVVTAKEDGIYFMSRGDVDSVTYRIGRDSLSNYDCEGEVKSMYSIDYLKAIAKNLKPFDKVTVELAQDYPIKVTAKLEHDYEDKITVFFLLAPRIEPD